MKRSASSDPLLGQKVRHPEYGVGTVVGSTLAAILIAEITSALVFINVSPYWTDALRGGLILATVIADILRRQRRAAQGWKR